VKLPKSFEKSRASLYVLLIFLCGVVSGALATNLWTGKPRQTTVAQADNSRGPFSRPQRLVDRFTKDLNLTPHQANQLAEILDEMRLRYQIKEDSTRAEGRNRIRQILTDGQREKYEEIIADADNRRRLRRQQGQ
jgi:Spy/CpxP family protein refolding chaperone